MAVLAWLVLRGPSGLLEAPRPEAAGGVPAPAEPPPSALVVPVSIPLELLVGLLDEAVPASYGSLEDRTSVPGEDRLELAFRLERGGFQASVHGDTARVEAVVEYALRAWYDPPVLPAVSGSCGDDAGPRPRLRVVYEAPVALTPEWGLATRARVALLAPASDEDRDRCRMTFLDYDVTGHVVEAARGFLEGHEATLDSMAASVELRPSFQGWWSTLSEPIGLADSVWLVMGPEAVRRGAVRGSGDTLRIPLALRARPRVVVGPRPAVEPAELPELEEGPAPPGLEIRVEGRAEYGTAAEYLERELAGTVLERGGRRVRLDSLGLFGVGDGRVALEVWTSGDLEARLYLTGTPALDRATRLLGVPDLDYDVASENLVAEAATWLQGFGLRSLLRERARWPAAPAEEWLREWLHTGLNREISSTLRIRGTVDTLSVDAVTPLPEALRVLIRARAQAAVELLPPGG